uniref:Si:ch211-130m23.5 n=1 Tax=Oryzias sinensis TaxID=183150 RepID=A0A8C8A3K3_9TELE
MATARTERELFTILETSSADPESSTECDSQESPLNLSADVKWLEIPNRKQDSDEEEEDEVREEEVEEEEEDGEGENGFTAAAAAAEAADAASFIAGGGCNIILVTGSNGIKHDEEDYAEDCYYSTSTNCSDATSNDSDIDFSDLEEEEERRGFFRFDDDLDEDCASPDFWGEPDQVIAIEPFSAASGPQHSLGDDADTRDYFRLLFPDSLFEHMVEQTNNYALYRQRRSGKSDPHWHPTDVREMKAYVGLNILMGINQLPDTGMYWASDIFIGNAGFKKTMTARRFEKLTQYLQLCDREAEPVRGERCYDGLYKIRPLLDVVENTMWDTYTPNRCLTIDKCSIATKGRFSPTQYMSSKPVKKGLTVWMLCDSRSGYCHRTKIHVGRPSEDEGAASLGYRVVTFLVRGLERQYHHLFMDSFFTSVPLLQRLLRDGLYACGPTLPGRRGYPEVLRPRNVGKLCQGEFYQCQHGNLVATVTRDVKMVNCLSTNSAPGIVGISPGRQQHDKEEEESDSMDGCLGVPRPLPLLLYQENMRGVDLCDQLRECYQVGRPCKKWWRYFLWFYVNLCIVNAYIVMRESRGGAPPAGFNGKLFTQRHFRVRLAQQLIGDYQGARGMERAARKRHADSPIEYGHRLERMSERSRRCRNCTNKGLRHESVFGCKICNVHLCRDKNVVLYLFVSEDHFGCKLELWVPVGRG